MLSGPMAATATMTESEIRFAFGGNWRRFLKRVDEARITEAEKSLRGMLDCENLDGKAFLDAGCGSGLFSLAAVRLGAAKVHSFDYDPASVACAQELKRRYLPDAANWTIERGDVLDPVYLSALRQFDVVYSWGVLHHTGDMEKAFANVVGPVAPGGRLFIAIYNDQGIYSRLWKIVKGSYSRWPVIRLPLIVVFAPYFAARAFLARLLGLRLSLKETMGSIKHSRGMAFWPDLLDWLGGYPFEVATPALVFDFFHSKDLELQKFKTVGRRSGNNEYVFIKHP